MAKGKRVSTVPSDETKADKFKRLANGRAVNAIKAIRGLGKLATSAYERTPEQVDALDKAIGGELRDACGKLRGTATAKAGVAPVL